MFIRFLYDLQQSIEEKIEIIAKEVYGADGIELSPTAREQIERYKAQVRKSSDTGTHLVVYGYGWFTKNLTYSKSSDINNTPR